MPITSIEEAIFMVERSGATPAAFAKVAASTGWSLGKLEAAYERFYQSWLASRGYDI